MPQGTRERIGRVAVVVLGVVLCSGLVGCLSSDPPKKTTPPAVDTVPDQLSPGPVMGYSQTLLPVNGSKARKTNCPKSTGFGPAPPPEKPLFGSAFCDELVKRSHCSSVTT